MSASVVFSLLLPLERSFPLTHRVELDQLRARDRARHARILQDSVGGVVDFSVQGSSDPYFVGLYFTKVKLGSPPKEFNVQIDTGSDILWVTCNSCSDCPQSSALGIQLNFFDAASSSTAALVSCSDPMCTSALQSTATIALLRVISAVTLFNMEMEVGHRVIMCLMHFILTWFLGNL